MNEINKQSAELRAGFLKSVKEQLRLLDASAEASIEKDKQIEILHKRIQDYQDETAALRARRDQLDKLAAHQAEAIKDLTRQREGLVKANQNIYSVMASKDIKIEEQASVIENLNNRILEVTERERANTFLARDHRREGVKVGTIRLGLDGAICGYQLSRPANGMELWGTHGLYINAPDAAAEIRQLRQEINKLKAEVVEAKLPQVCCGSPDGCREACYWKFQHFAGKAIDAATASLAEQRAKLCNLDHLDPVQVNEQTK